MGAPTDSAFAKIDATSLNALLADTSKLTSVLLLHVVASKLTAADLYDGRVLPTAGGDSLVVSISGSMVYLTSAKAGGNVAQVTATDIMASNGVVHLIDTVLMLPTATTTMMSTTTESPMLSIPALVSQTPTLSTLLTAVQASPTALNALSGAGPFTVFAPTDSAFAKIDTASLNALLADTSKLASVLLLHVVASKLTAADLYDGRVLPTAGGDSLVVSISGSTVTL